MHTQDSRTPPTAMGVRRNAVTQVPITDGLAERVNYLFHHSLLSDSQIAIKMAEEDGLQSSTNQVQEIRLLFATISRRRKVPRNSNSHNNTLTNLLPEKEDLLAADG